ncbi:hypothetical protein CVT24_007176 [Panaeolus cyanescens]|uniref:Uncharacterized protein n=1 Tax=Panaeolus cyanescens TaxID=181874 RepID=A0A409YPH3_9AGAR|nr:hypothetical protein CVT24_007176 [Panaeolus cyanescens]
MLDAYPTGFFSASLQDLTLKFEIAVEQNVRLFGTTFNHQRLSTSIPCFDTLVWGQSSRSFSLAPDGAAKFTTVQDKFEPYWTESVQKTWMEFLVWGQSSRSFSLAPDGAAKFTTVQDKFEPYWTESVQKTWMEFLGPILDQDPFQLCTENIPTWTTAYHMLVNLQIRGFQTGLTVFQCANNLALLGICREPTCTELVTWISKHKHLGAWKAIKTLDFVTDSRQQGSKQPNLSIYAIFYILWKHLDDSLTDSDKQILGFGPMFVEHLLCKVRRYTKRWLDYSKEVEKQENQQESNAAVWEAGKNERDCFVFPFPIVLKKDEIIKILESYDVTA